MRIVFIGAVHFSEKLLETLIALEANIVGVCTLEEAPFSADHTDLSKIANAARIPVRYTPDINAKESIEWIESHSPDVIFCFGWSRLIKDQLLKLAPLGVIGYHPAALPANRGRHPLIWALVLGLRRTASTFFFMDEGVDSGDILSQKPVDIYESDDACALYKRMTDAASAQLREFLPALANGRHTRTPQIHVHANEWRKRRQLDGQIDWRMSAYSICNLIRALSHPYPGAHFIHDGQQIKVWRSEVVIEPRNNLEPGKVLSVATDGIIIKAGNDAVRLIHFEPKIVLHVDEYIQPH